MLGRAVVLSALLLSLLLVGCLGNSEVGVDQATVINVKPTGSAFGASCEVALRMEDGSAKTITTSKCPELNQHVCVTKSAMPAIVEGCKWT